MWLRFFHFSRLKVLVVVGGVGNLSYSCSGGRQEQRDQCFDLRGMWRYVLQSLDRKVRSSTSILKVSVCWRIVYILASNP